MDFSGKNNLINSLKKKESTAQIFIKPFQLFESWFDQFRTRPAEPVCIFIFEFLYNFEMNFHSVLELLREPQCRM